MNRYLPSFVAIPVLAALSFGLAAPARALDLTAELLTAKKVSGESLDKGLAALKKKTEDKFAEIKDTLADKWKEDLGKTVAEVTAKLDAQRLKIVEGLTGDPERLDRVSSAATAQFGNFTKKLTELKDGVGQRLTDAGYDPKKAGVTEAALKEVALKALAALTVEMGNVLNEASWSGPLSAIQASNAAPTANEQAKAADEAVKAFIEKAEGDFSDRVKCDYVAATGTLVCNKSLAISGAAVSSILVRGLPTDKEIDVSASAASGIDGGELDPASDSLTIHPGNSGSVAIDVYLLRRASAIYSPSRKLTKAVEEVTDITADEYEHLSREAKAAVEMRSLREAPSGVNDLKSDSKADFKRKPPRLKLVVEETAPNILLEVNVKDEKGSSFSIDVGFSRWGVSTGGFIAIAPLSDKEVKTIPTTTAGMVKVLQITKGHDFRQDTGIFLNLVPRNYPLLGIGIGFSTNDNDTNMLYLGPSIRLTTFRDRGVASFSIGGMMRSVARFPGLKENDVVSATDPLLLGKRDYKFAAYGLIQLGFAFGRIPGGEDN